MVESNQSNMKGSESKTGESQSNILDGQPTVRGGIKSIDEAIKEEFDDEESKLQNSKRYPSNSQNRLTPSKI